MPDPIPTPDPRTPPAPWLADPPTEQSQRFHLPTYSVMVYWWPRGVDGDMGLGSVSVTGEVAKHEHIATLLRWLSQRRPSNEPASNPSDDRPALPEVPLGVDAQLEHAPRDGNEVAAEADTMAHRLAAPHGEEGREGLAQDAQVLGHGDLRCSGSGSRGAVNASRPSLSHADPAARQGDAPLDHAAIIAAPPAMDCDDEIDDLDADAFCVDNHCGECGEFESECTCDDEAGS